MKKFYLFIMATMSFWAIQAQNIATSIEGSDSKSLIERNNKRVSNTDNNQSSKLLNVSNSDKNKPDKNSRQNQKLRSNKPGNINTNQLKSTTVVLWSDDFSVATNWTIGNLAGNTQNWVISSTGPTGTYSSQIGPINSTTATNGYAMYDSDAIGSSANLLGDQNAFIRTANSINLAGHPYVKVRFEQLYRKYNSQTFIGIKVGTANWVEIEVNANLAANDFGNDVVEVDISSIAGNQTDVKLYFRYYGEWDYVWMVDDVSIEDAFINDATTQFVYALGEQPIGVNDNIQALVQNTGAGDITNLDVTLSVTGANIFTNVQTIPLLQIGELLTVTFDNYTPANTGLNNITVSVENDNNNNNNSFSYYHETDTTFAFADTSDFNQGLGYNTDNGLILCKYWAESSLSVTDVKIFISSDTGNPGNTIYAVVLDNSGNIIGTSSNLVIAATDLETWHTFNIPIQPTFANTEFYVGVAQTANATSGYYPLGTQAEAYSRNNAYYISNIDGTGIVEANTYGRFMIKALMGTGISYDIGIAELIAPNNIGGCALTNSESVTVRIENFGIQDISNFPVSYSINGGILVTETVSTTVASGSYYDHTFAGTVDLSSYQMYDFLAYTGLINDEYTANDSLSYSVTSGDAVINVEILTDSWGEETYWGIFNSAGDLIFSDGNYDDTTLFSIDVCVLSTDCYTFLIIDDYGDGILAPGYFQISYNNVIVTTNTNFTGSEEWVYNIGGGCPENELGIDMVYTLGRLPKNQGSPHVITALIYNYGTISQTNVPVTLTISGDNSFSDTQTIPLIQSGEEIYVDFSDFNPLTTGINDISVSIPSDEDLTNNLFSQYQEVNNTIFGYPDTSAVIGSIGYNTSQGLLFNKHFMNGGGQVVEVGIHLSDDVNTTGNTIYAVVLDSDTNIVAQSVNYIVQSSDINNMLYLNLSIPVSFLNEIFFVGFAQIENTSTGFFPLATQNEPFTRPDTYFGSELDGTNAVEYTDLGRFYLEAVLTHGPDWNYTNTGSNHTILIPSSIEVSINGTQIEPGDFVGVFYDQSGVMACGGYTIYTGNIDALSAWGSQSGLDDGFQSGENYSWRIWDATDEMVYNANAVYNTLDFPNEGFYITNGMSGLASLIATTVESQTINLVEGWSIFSTYLDVFQPNLDSVFSSIINNIQIVKDGNGLVYWPQWGVNGIGSITIGEGYQVNSTIYQNLILNGVSVVPENTQITIQAGWSILGYLRNSPLNIATVLTSIVNEIIIVKNGAGGVYWPQWGVNGIGDMMPGEGYQINMNISQNFTFPANTTISAKSNLSNIQILELNTGNNMTIGFPASCFPGSFKKGDIISAFNMNNMLVGQSVFNRENLALTVWGDDFLSVKDDGMLKDEKIQFVIQSGSESINFIVSEWVYGSEEYMENKISLVKSIEIEEATILYQNYPNPASTSTEIRFIIPQESKIRLELLNIVGEFVYLISDMKYEKGTYSIPVDISNIPQGTYFYRLTSKTYTTTKSMTINH